METYCILPALAPARSGCLSRAEIEPDAVIESERQRKIVWTQI